MIRLKKTVIRQGKDNYTNILLDTCKNYVQAFGGTKRLSIDCESLLFEKVISLKNDIYQFSYKQKEKPDRLFFWVKLDGLEKEKQQNKDYLDRLGFQFNSIGEYSTRDYRTESNPFQSNRTMSQNTEVKNEYQQMISQSSESKNSIIRKKSFDVEEESSSFKSAKKGSIGSLYRIFKPRQDGSSISSNLIISGEQSQEKQLCERGPDLIVSGNNMISRISNYFRISPYNYKYNLKTSARIKDTLNMYIEPQTNTLPLNFYGSFSNNIFYCMEKGYSELRNKEFVTNIVERNRISEFTLKRTDAVEIKDTEEENEIEKIELKNCLDRLVSYNVKIGKKIISKEYATFTVSSIFRNFIHRKKNSTRVSFKFLGFFDKFRKLINMYLTVNFDMNSHLEFVKAFLDIFKLAMKEMEELVLGYFSYRNKDIKIGNFYVFLLRLFSYEIEMLISEFRQIFMELLSCSNYCDTTDRKSFETKQRAVIEFFKNINEVGDSFEDIRYEGQESREIRRLINFIIDRDFTNLRFMLDEMKRELSNLKEKWL